MLLFLGLASFFTFNTFLAPVYSPTIPSITVPIILSTTYIWLEDSDFLIENFDVSRTPLFEFCSTNCLSAFEL